MVVHSTCSDDRSDSPRMFRWTSRWQLRRLRWTESKTPFGKWGCLPKFHFGLLPRQCTISAGLVGWALRPWLGCAHELSVPIQSPRSEDGSHVAAYRGQERSMATLTPCARACWSGHWRRAPEPSAERRLLLPNPERELSTTAELRCTRRCP